MIGFLHVPKTGGTSLRVAFEKAGYRVWRPRGARYTLDVQADLDGVDVVAGHIPFGVFSRLPLTTWVTMLRHPVERWLSHYFAEAGPEPGNYPAVGVVPDNIACRMLTAGLGGPVDADAAISNLVRFDHVGFTENLPATFARFGLEPTNERRSDRPRGADVPAWLYDAAHEQNEADLRLYEIAREELWTLLPSEPSPA